MARIPEQTIEEIKRRNDILDVVSSYVRFTKRSGQNHFGLCPFHEEKTPSFSVSQDKQMFYCFGCHKGGDVISFIMGIEHMTYPEAVRFLAEKAGVDIPEDTQEDPQYLAMREKRKKLIEINTEAARYFYMALQSPLGKEAKLYLKKRGISPKTQTVFGLGYAPDRWQGLYNHLLKKGFAARDINESGLFRQNKKGGWFDLFRDRLVFPIIDVMGNIIAFGARVLGDGMPKYLNSPETTLYTKGKHLYGLNLAKRSRDDRLIIVEGYMDCIALHQAGFDQAVASLGTALTPDQAGLIRKYREEVVLAYDNDRAGRMATLRNIDVLKDKNVGSFILMLDQGKDPDEYIHRFGKDQFELYLNRAMPEQDYKFYHAKEEATVDGHLDKLLYQDLAGQELLKINNPVVRQLYIPRVAEVLGVPDESVSLLLEMKEEQGDLPEKKRSAMRDRREPLPRPKAADQTQAENAAEDKKIERLSAHEASFLVRLARRPDLYKEGQVQVEASWFSDKEARALVKEILELADEEALNENVLIDKLNSLDPSVRQSLAEPLNRALFEEDNVLNDKDLVPMMQMQSLTLEEAYYSRLSRYFTYLLDHPKPGQDNHEVRQKFMDVRQKREAVVQAIKEKEQLIRSQSNQ